jgi:hypothetical protein
MVNHPGFKANEIGTEAIAHDGVWRFQFYPGNQRGLDLDLDQNRMSKDTGKRRATGLNFLRGYCTSCR